MGFTRAQLQAFRDAAVPDLIGPGLRLLFVGINPGLWTAATQTHFAYPSNRFYPALFEAGIIDRIPDYANGLNAADRAELTARGLGITNFVNRATVDEKELSDAEIQQGAVRLADTVRMLRPRVVAILGIGAYQKGFAVKKAVRGRQSHQLEGAELWVLPNPSPLSRGESVSSLARAYAEPARAAGLIP